jgi:hypothetical protein
MNIYATYAAVNRRLLQEEKLFIDGDCGAGGISSRQTDGSRSMHYPRIGIYAGDGTSHSWLWFVDMLDRMGFHDIAFLDAPAIQHNGLAGIDVLMVSGGDTFAVARALGPSGAQKLRDFIAAGGMYFGTCAGAYLVMNSSKPHLNNFNFTAVKITNLTKSLPQCSHLPHKFSLAYGCDYIYHPVREAVQVRTTGHAPFAAGLNLDAPLYGGPGMLAPEDAQVLALYQDFTDKTVYLVDPRLARSTLVGTAAVLRAPLGKGWMYLCGPHFEHPGYPQANALIADAVYWDTQPSAARRQSKAGPPVCAEMEGQSLLKDIKRQVSNSRISAGSLEMQPIRWLIGAKYYEPEKIRYFLEAIWYRLAPLEKHGCLRATVEQAACLRRYAEATTLLVRQLKQHVEQMADTHHLAEKLFGLLHRYAITFLEMYFQTVCEPTPNCRR